MSPAKKFLLIFFGVALVVWIGANAVLGPPGYSRAYLDEYQTEHEHYLEITKSPYYKLYAERPALHPPDGEEAPHGFAEQVAFVEHYESREAFAIEQHRMHRYELFFEFFNAGLVVVLIWRFGRRPLANLLDAKIADLRERIESAAHARKTAESRLRKAETQLSQIPEEQARVAEQTQERIKRELAQLEEANELTLKVLSQEMADRKDRIQQSGRTRVRRELVKLAVARIEADYREGWDSTREAAQFEQFIEGLEKGA